MKITIIGTGYVGLPTACAFAKYGHEVVCIDTDAEKIKKLQAHQATIYEEGLQELLNEVGNNILFTTDAFYMKDSDAIFITVGTPMAKDGSADLKYIYSAAESIAENAPKSIVVLKSTVPVGTCKKISEILPSAKIASMPEFLREGLALRDIFNPDRIIIGTPSDKVYDKLYKIYPRELRKKINRVCNWESSELIKYASNAFLATKIHFINEIADLCERVGADVYDVANGMGLDSRIGEKFLQAGPGYGGSCFPKDTNALYALAENNCVDLSIVEATIKGNKRRQKKFAAIISGFDRMYGRNPKIAVLGLAFKAGTDDVRESPALTIIENLESNNISVYDPMAMGTAFKSLKRQDIIYSASIQTCVQEADIVVLATDWDDFYIDNIPEGEITKSGFKPILYDLRNFYKCYKRQIEEKGYIYIGVGDGEK